MDDLLTPQQAAKKLAISTRTLQTWRTTGKGPKFIQVDKIVRYRGEDIKAWIERKVSES
ncbi:helix-turn-helix transcriptional regulator [Arcanobacterium phocae]|uniref:helix-turn-helix transcriptional regulator n=1 Tax=Arcanobacterium phocae TaxID=131112 RepID=UPI001C0F1AF1|nr:helix-turn-helix domain-containing protein [Arcanobacterium phocae]